MFLTDTPNSETLNELNENPKFPTHNYDILFLCIQLLNMIFSHVPLLFIFHNDIYHDNTIILLIGAHMLLFTLKLKMSNKSS